MWGFRKKSKKRIINKIKEEKMKREIRKIVTLVCILCVTVATVLPSTIVTAENDRGITNGTFTPRYDKGPVFTAIELALTKGGSIKKDLIKRGLFTIPDPKGEPGVIKVGEIKKLIDAGIYIIDRTNTLTLNDYFSVDTQVDSEKVIIVDKVYATMDNGNGYQYQGHKAWVTIPTSITLDADTVHNIYTTHMGLSNDHYVETGVGWISWDDSPVIFTYDTYIDTWRYRSITSGVSRNIELKIDIIPDPPYGGLAEMYVYDPYDDVCVQDYRAVSSMNHDVDQCQEQASTGDWTETPDVVQYDNDLKNSSGNWVNWGSSIPTAFWDNSPPMDQDHGISSNRYWIETECDP